MFCSYLGQTKGSVSDLCNWNQELYENTLAGNFRKICARTDICTIVVV